MVKTVKTAAIFTALFFLPIFGAAEPVKTGSQQKNVEDFLTNARFPLSDAHKETHALLKQQSLAEVESMHTVAMRTSEEALPPHIQNYLYHTRILFDIPMTSQQNIDLFKEKIRLDLDYTKRHGSFESAFSSESKEVISKLMAKKENTEKKDDGETQQTDLEKYTTIFCAQAQFPLNPLHVKYHKAIQERLLLSFQRTPSLRLFRDGTLWEQGLREPVDSDVNLQLFKAAVMGTMGARKVIKEKSSQNQKASK